MEVVAVAVFGALTTSLVAKLLAVADKVIDEKGKASEAIDENIESLQSELRYIHAAMRDHLSHEGQSSDLKIVSMDEIRALAHNIEDCLDRFLPCAACGAEQIHGAKKFNDQIKALTKKLKRSHELKRDFGVTNQNSTSTAQSNVDHTAYQHTCTYGAYPAVGMEEPTLELYQSLVGGEANKLRVVSIVGFGGSGKTALAWAVYNSDQVKEQFPFRAWAQVSKHQGDAKGLLTAILKGLLGAEAQQAVPQDIGQIQLQITRQLETKRCLVGIDDVNCMVWDNIITHMLPKEKTESRILVTTAVTTVANYCSFHGGYIYNMKSLSAKQSKDYIEEAISLGQWSDDKEVGSRAIVNRCDGHPLALVSVANAVKKHGSNWTAAHCTDICDDLCSSIEKNENGHFTELGQVLLKHYNSLPNDSLKTCLLYASLFPNGGPICRKSLTRRWLAEGYIEGDLKLADEKFKQLIDRNVIRPIDTSNNGNAKTCKTHSIMHQFMLHKSMSSNFIARSFGAQNRSNCRHLIIENHRDGTASSSPAANSRNQLSKLVDPVKKKVAKLFKNKHSKKLRPRSLTIFGRAEEAVSSDIANLQLLRVLDLKECSDFHAGHLDKIYQLMHLKYLSLGRFITNLSDDGMKRLHHLETLDLTNTKIDTLPLEIIILPHLQHLFGKIKLNKLNGRNIDMDLVKKSKLRTVAGVVIDSNSGFPELMPEMKQLKKVKIWCRDSNTQLSNAIREFCKTGIETAEGACSEIATPNSQLIATPNSQLHLIDPSDLLNHNQDDNANARVIFYLGSLKLHGRPSQFEFCNSICGLRELCLTSTGLKWSDLPALRNLQLLICLKLVQDNLEGLHINKEDFRSLQRLCLVVKEPKFPTIAKEALPNLTSIQLLCGGLHDLGGIEIERFKALCEVVLDSAVNQDTIKLWEERAKNHPKRPKIVFLKRVDPADFLKRVDPADTRCAVKYVAIDQIPSGPLLQGTSTTNQIPSGPLVQGTSTTNQIPSGSLVQGTSTTNQIPSGPLVQGTSTTNQIPSGPLVQGITTSQIPSGPLVQGTSTTNQIPSGPLVQGTSTTNQIPSGPLVQGISTTDQIPSGPPVQGITTGQISSGLPVQAIAATNQIPSGPPVQEIATNQMPSGPPVQAIATDLVPSGPPVQAIDTTNQITSGPPVQGIATDQIPSGPPVHAMA